MIKKIKAARVASLGGILAAMAVMFQSAPIFLPAAGLLLSPLSTLPVALAAFLGIAPGMAVLFSASVVLCMFSPQEAVILLLTTGPLGIALGWGLKRKNLVLAALVPGAVLFAGMVVLTYVVGIAAFGSLTSSFSWDRVLLIFLVFAFVYAFLWAAALERMVKRLYCTEFFRRLFGDTKE